MLKPGRTFLPVVAALALFCGSCSTLPDLSPDPASSVRITRRLYVNDPAANDSLARALFKGQVDFVLQPGQSYRLRVKTSTVGDRLAVYVLDNVWKSWNILNPAGFGNGVDTFNLTSDRISATYFSAKFLPVDSTVLKRLSVGSRPWVSLSAVDTTQSHALKVHLFIVGSLTQLPEFSAADSASKVQFAVQFLQDLKEIFATYDVVLSDSSSYEIVQPNLSPVTVSFNSPDTTLPGTRLPGCLHLYLVDNIYAAGLPPGQHVIGFAPRESKDLNVNAQSRVVLSATSTGSIIEMARTTAHETGHFFGLRHVWATSSDMANDSDLSNLDDGFPSTLTCTTGILSKRSALPLPIEVPLNSGGYCFRVNGNASTCSGSCDPSAVKNLMFAFSCPVAQDSLTDEQQVFERRNMSILGVR